MRLVNYTIYSVANALRHWGVDFHEQTEPRVVGMKKEIVRIGGKIEFKIEQYPTGEWTAESTNLDGIVTGGKSRRDIPATIRDAVFTYFGIPPHLCNPRLLKADNEPVTTTQRVYV